MSKSKLWHFVNLKKIRDNFDKLEINLEEHLEKFIEEYEVAEPIGNTLSGVKTFDIIFKILTSKTKNVFCTSCVDSYKKYIKLFYEDLKLYGTVEQED